MGAPKNREIHAVERYVKDGGAVRVKVTVTDEYGDRVTIPARELTGAERITAIAIRWPGATWPNVGRGSVWMRATLEERDQALRAETLDAARVIAVAVAERVKREGGGDGDGGNDAGNEGGAGGALPEAIREPIPNNDSMPTPATPAPLAVGQYDEAVRNVGPFMAEAIATIADHAIRSNPAVTLDAVRGIVTDAVRDAVTSEGVRQIEVRRANGVVHELALTHETFPILLVMLAARTNVAMVGPMGSGKSTAAKQCAESLGVRFASIAWHGARTQEEVTGFMDVRGEYVRTAFRDAVEHGGVFMHDELDRAHPSILPVLNEYAATPAGGMVSFPDQMVKVHEDFVMVAGLNTFGTGPDRIYAAASAQDGATLDRFEMLYWGYDQVVERKIALQYATDETRSMVNEWVDEVQSLRRKVETERVEYVVSPRRSENGARLLAAGLPIGTVREVSLYRGLTADARARLDLPTRPDTLVGA